MEITSKDDKIRTSLNFIQDGPGDLDKGLFNIFACLGARLEEHEIYNKEK